MSERRPPRTDCRYLGSQSQVGLSRGQPRRLHLSEVRGHQAIVAGRTDDGNLVRPQVELCDPVGLAELGTDRGHVGRNRSIAVEPTDRLDEFPMPQQDEALSPAESQLADLLRRPRYRV